MEYLIHILVLVAVYTIVVVGLDLSVGHGGLICLAQAAFYGIGAYSTAILTLWCGSPFMFNVLLAVVIATAASVAVSVPALRLRDEHYAIGTLGFQVIIFSVFHNWMTMTGGPLGIPGIPRPEVFGWTVRTELEFLLLAGVGAVLACTIVWRLAHSPLGRILRGIREDEVFTAALGKNPIRCRLIATATSAALAAVAGCLYAHYVTYIDPSSFGIMESILMLSMVILGGAGSRWGPLVGAACLVLLPELLTFIGLSGSAAADVRQLLYGSLLILLMVFRPQGLAGAYRLDR